MPRGGNRRRPHSPTFTANCQLSTAKCGSRSAQKPAETRREKATLKACEEPGWGDHPGCRPGAGGLWTVDRGPWTVDRGPWTVDRGPWIRMQPIDDMDTDSLVHGPGGCAKAGRDLRIPVLPMPIVPIILSRVLVPEI
ncbi:hypothetical protein E4U55_007293 [Claviceps digitariae]|nr:hypothetical protein E4U55_007293 [Claviceps digitariae]